MGNLNSKKKTKDKTVETCTSTDIDIDESKPVPESKPVSEYNRLKNLDINTVAKIPFTEEFMLAKVTEVYDGDTVTVVFFYGTMPVRMKIRVNGIDAPEKRGSPEYEKDAALHVQKEVARLTDQKILYIKLDKNDKYGGRMLGEVYLDQEKKNKLSEHLLKRGYVKPYEGKKKEPWTKEECITILSK